MTRCYGFDRRRLLLYFDKLGNMEEKTAVIALAALAQEARLRVFRTLVGAAPSGLTPGAIAAMLGISGSTLSFHLKELVHAGLVTVVRDGRNLIYQPAIDHMNALLDYLTAHCCQGQSCCSSDPIASTGDRQAGPTVANAATSSPLKSRNTGYC
jgi:ArsR family transcriptional regulator, arsenate/arsenite/antimonite-responsive transcriptional repressor